MDSKQNNKSQIEDTERLKEIPKWTRKHAQNRTLTLLVLLVIISLISMGTAFPLAFGIAAFTKGNPILGLSLAVMAIVLWIALFIATFKKFGGKNRGLLDRLIEQRIYGKEGTASMPMPKSSKKKNCLEILSVVIFFICFFGSWHLAMEGCIAFKYLQPVSALYIVPYAVCGWYFWQSPRMGPIYLLFPILYAIHAILIVAGVPLFFTGDWCILSIGIPFNGYGFLPFIIGHFYGRYALKKLKRITRLEGDATNGV